jgi:bacteriorhodopsin
MNSSSEKQNPNSYLIKSSFTITYILLLTTATITFIEALRTNIPMVRHILNLETCISIVAGYFYSIFVEKTNNSDIKNWSDITKLRYIDWSITTPMMLLTLCLVLGMHTKVPIKIGVFLLILFFNYAMLYIGYLGEINLLDRITGCLVGFIAFFAMFSIIFQTFVRPKYVQSNYVLYFLYFFIWSLYGVVYLFGEEWKNIAMNILDFIAKCFIGLGLWCYYTNIFVI